MQKASYTTVQTASGGSGKYPLSTQTLDFIQQQILLLQEMSRIGGDKYVLKKPDGESTGVVVIAGEVFSVDTTSAFSMESGYIVVNSESADIVADGETYQEARTTRTAAYSKKAKGDENYDVKEFRDFSESGILNDLETQMQNMRGDIDDIMNEKLTVMSKSGAISTFLDGQKDPIMLNCVNSFELFGETNYCLLVTKIGTLSHQQITLPDGRQYVRTYENDEWSDWGRINDDLHLEVKIANGAVYLRHGYLPSGASIVLLRKKRRSKYRSTGGDNASDSNMGKRIERLPKTQYVHFKGIELSQGTPNKWYEPTCISVMDDAVDRDLIDMNLLSLCDSLAYKTSEMQSMSEPEYRIQGMNITVCPRRGKGYQRKAYVPIAIQVTRTNVNAKEVGGEMVKLKYRVSCIVEGAVLGNKVYGLKRSISLD